MSKEIVFSEGAPKAIGPYSQAVKVGPLVFTSGQIGLDPVSGELCTSGIEDEVRQVMTNLAAVLGAAGAGWDDVVRTTIYLTNLSDFAVVNRVYGEHFGSAPPARATVQVAALPKGASVEIDCIAHVGAR